MKRPCIRVRIINVCGVSLMGGALLLQASAVDAATTSTTFTVNATVLAACTLSATNMEFGNYDANAGTPTDTTASLNVLCTNGQPYTVSLDAGTTSGNSVAVRNMTDGSELLSYGLYTDTTRGTIWGDGTAGTSTVTGTGNGSQQALTVYGRVPVNQRVAQGSYSDTITATVTY